MPTRPWTVYGPTGRSNKQRTEKSIRPYWTQYFVSMVLQSLRLHPETAIPSYYQRVRMNLGFSPEHFQINTFSGHKAVHQKM